MHRRYGPYSELVSAIAEATFDIDPKRIRVTAGGFAARLVATALTVDFAAM